MVERATSSRSHYLPPSVESILGSEDEGRRSIRVSSNSTMKKSRRRHRQSGGSTSSSSIPEQSSPSIDKAMPKSNTSRKLSIPDIANMPNKKGPSLPASEHARETQTSDVTSTVANQAKERTEGDSVNPRVKKIEGMDSDRPSDSSGFSSTKDRARSNSESNQAQFQSKTSTPNVFSFMELPESQNVNTVYWQRQEWLRQQAEQRANAGAMPRKIVTAETPRRVAVPSTEKRDSPVSSDSGIGLESELADIPEQGHDETSVNSVQSQRTTARAAFAPLLRGISQRSAQRPGSSRSEAPLESTTPISGSRLDSGMPTPRPIIHHFRPDLSEQASPAIRPRSSNIESGETGVNTLSTKRVVSGYERFASKLSAFSKTGAKDDSFCPVYRRFDNLNQRLFLHLQDEIVEIEDELRQIDDADARLRAAASSSDGHELPESRRFGANAKVDVLGRAYVKLGQYNQALLSYNKLIQKMDVANPSDVERLKSWLRMENPVKNTEARFLDCHDDLLALCKTSAQSSHNRNGLKISNYLQQPAAIRISTIFLLSIFAFRLVPSFLGRLLVTGICALASLAVHQPASSENGEFSKYLILYVGFMTIASAIIK